MDTHSNYPTAVQDELHHRRKLALARHEREHERNELLQTLLEAERRASQLRAWIASRELHLKPETDSELHRMVRWASRELATLETMMEPQRLTELLGQRNLFPEVDKLSDPLGDPPPRRPWGR